MAVHHLTAWLTRAREGVGGAADVRAWRVTMGAGWDGVTCPSRVGDKG